MAWNKDNPVETEKIRLLSEVITANNTAIEQNDVTTLADSLSQWVIHLVDRSTIAGANDPARIDTIGMLYCKDDGAKNELFFRDSENPSNIIQLTNDGKIGFTSTAFEMDSISFDGTITYDEHSMHRAWGIVAAGSGFTTYHGFAAAGSVTSGGTGIHNFDISTLGPAGGPFASANDYGVIATTGFTSRIHIAAVYNKGVGSFSVRIQNDKGDAAAVPFTIMLLT